MKENNQVQEIGVKPVKKGKPEFYGDMQTPDPEATIVVGLKKEVEELKSELALVKESEKRYMDDFYSELSKRSKYENAFKALVEELTQQFKK